MFNFDLTYLNDRKTEILRALLRLASGNLSREEKTYLASKTSSVAENLVNVGPNEEFDASFVQGMMSK